MPSVVTAPGLLVMAMVTVPAPELTAVICLSVTLYPDGEKPVVTKLLFTTAAEGSGVGNVYVALPLDQETEVAVPADCRVQSNVGLPLVTMLAAAMATNALPSGSQKYQCAPTFCV